MSENKPQLILFTIGLLLIGWIFYYVNIKENTPSSKQQKQTISKPKSSVNTSQYSEPIPNNSELTVENSEEKAKSEKYTEKSYHEVFKEEPPLQSDIERITEEQRAAKLKEKSDALIKKAEALIEEKNLKAGGNPLSAEELERLENKIEELKKK